MPSLRKLDGRGAAAAASVTRDGEDAEAQADEAPKPKKGKKRKLPKKDNSHEPQSRKRGDGGGSKQATSDAAASQTVTKAKKGKNRKLDRDGAEGSRPVELPFTGICQRGKLVCNICDNGAGVHRITGLWAVEGLSRILEAPDECEKFEYEHMCSGDSTAFELSGRYTGGFFNGAVKIVERDVTLRFQQNDAGYHNVYGEGSNEFGKYSIVGTLAEDGTITLSRHYPAVGRPAARAAAVARSLDDRHQVAKAGKGSKGGSRKGGAKRPMLTNEKRKSDDGGSGPPLTAEEKKEKERFLMFTRVLVKYLEQRDAVMHANAKAQSKECYEKNKQGDPAFQSLTTSMKARLRATVGEYYWKKAHDYLDHFLKQKKEIVMKRMEQESSSPTSNNSFDVELGMEEVLAENAKTAQDTADGEPTKKRETKESANFPMKQMKTSQDERKPKTADVAIRKEMVHIKEEDTDDEAAKGTDCVYFKVVYPAGCEHEEEMIELYRSEYITFADVRRGIIEQGIDVPFATFRFLVEAGGASITPTQEEKWKVRKFDLMKDGAEMDGTFHRPYHIFVKEHHCEAAVP